MLNKINGYIFLAIISLGPWMLGIYWIIQGLPQITLEPINLNPYVNWFHVSLVFLQIYVIYKAIQGSKFVIIEDKPKPMMIPIEKKPLPTTFVEKKDETEVFHFDQEPESIIAQIRTKRYDLTYEDLKEYQHMYRAHGRIVGVIRNLMKPWERNDLDKMKTLRKLGRAKSLPTPMPTRS